MGQIKDLKKQIADLEEANEYLLNKLHEIEDKPLKEITARRIRRLEGAIDGMGMQNASLEIRIAELEEMLRSNESIRGHIQERVHEAEGHQIQLIWALDGMERIINEGTTLCREDWMYTVRDVNKTLMELHSMTMLLGDFKKVE